MLPQERVRRGGGWPLGRGGQLPRGGRCGGEEAGHHARLPWRRGLGARAGRRLEADHCPRPDHLASQRANLENTLEYVE